MTTKRSLDNKEMLSRELTKQAIQDEEDQESDDLGVESDLESGDEEQVAEQTSEAVQEE